VSLSQECPRCGATAPLDAAWCSLCLERFDRPEDVGPADQADRFDPLTAPLEQLSQPASPGVSEDRLAAPAEPDRPAPQPTGEVAPERAADPAVAAGTGADVDTMLVLLAAEHRSQDPLAGLAHRMDDRTTRTMVIAGGAVGLAVLLFAVLAVLSLLG